VILTRQYLTALLTMQLLMRREIMELESGQERHSMPGEIQGLQWEIDWE
jgi:hypothetical protein